MPPLPLDTTAPHDRSHSLNALTGLRFFAAGAIVIHHLRGHFGLPADYGLVLGQAVSFFFVLSGFILSYNYRTFDTVAALLRYYAARASRIWPVHAVTFVLAVLLVYNTRTLLSEPAVALLNLSLLHSWIPVQSIAASINVPTWSISCELFFYLMFPLFIGRQPRILAAGAVCLLIVATVVVLDVINPQRFFDTNVNKANVFSLVHYNPVIRIAEFCFGIVLFGLFDRVRGRVSGSSAISVKGSIVECVAFGAVIAVFIWWRPLLGQAKLLLDFNDVLYIWLLRSGLFPLFGLLILIAAFRRGIVSWFFGLPVSVFLGEASYSMYIIHGVLIAWLVSKESLFVQYPDMLGIGIIISIVLLASIALYTLVELPVRSWIMSHFPSRRTG